MGNVGNLRYYRVEPVSKYSITPRRHERLTFPIAANTEAPGLLE